MQPSRAFYVNQKKELCNNGGLYCYYFLYYYNTKVLLFFDICKHFGNFLCEKSVFAHILIYVNYYVALRCKSHSYAQMEQKPTVLQHGVIAHITAL